MDQRHSPFINRFMGHKVYNLLVKFMKYENPNEAERFYLIYNQDTPDLPSFEQLYYKCASLFIKWNRDFGVVKSSKTPFNRNYLDLIAQSKSFKKYIDKLTDLNEQVGDVTSQVPK